MPKGYQTCPSKWKEEALKTCIFCGEKFWPNQNSNYKAWLKRQYCGNACNRKHAHKLTLESQKP